MAVAIGRGGGGGLGREGELGGVGNRINWNEEDKLKKQRFSVDY